MVVFTYNDYCKCKKFLTINLNEDNNNYSVSNSTYNNSRSINYVHDKLYRDFLYDNSEFSLFLKNFLNINIDPNLLIKYNNTYITENFKNRTFDIVYKLKNKPIYFFLEHQSSIDNSISYRILEYYYYLLKSTIDQNKLKNKKYRLPIIVPILLYTGTSIWNHIPNFADKQYNIENDYYSFANNRLVLKYDFIDIHKYTIEKLLEFNSMVSYILATDKCTTNNELLTILYNICLRTNDDIKKTKLKRLITYVFKDFLDDNSKKILLNKLNERKDDSNMKYAWDYVREDIRRKNLALEKKGEKKGKKEGFFEAVNSIIKKMLENGESIEKIQLYSGSSIKEIEKIKKELDIA